MADSALNNRFSAEFTPENLQILDTAKQMIGQNIMTKLVSLGTQGRRRLARVSDVNRAFTEAVLECSLAHPELRPPLSDIVEFQKDVTASAVMRPFRQWVKELLDLLDDSIALADTESYTGEALPFYVNTKSAAKLGQPAAVTVLAKLSPRFAVQRRSPKSTARRPAKGGLADTPAVRD